MCSRAALHSCRRICVLPGMSMGTSDNHFCTRVLAEAQLTRTSIPFASIYLLCVWYHKMFIHDKSIFSTTTSPELTVRQRSYCNCIPLQTSNSASFTVISLQSFFFVRFCCHFGFRAVPKDTSAKTCVRLGIHLKHFSHIMRCACTLDRVAMRSLRHQEDDE